MLLRLHQEKYVYTPYKRKDNPSPIASLQERLNANGVVTEFTLSPMHQAGIDQIYRLGRAQQAREVLKYCEAVLFSDESKPITLSLWQAVYSPPCDIFGGRDIRYGDISLRLQYYDPINRTDLAFIRRCVRESRFRFKERHPETL